MSSNVVIPSNTSISSNIMPRNHRKIIIIIVLVVIFIILVAVTIYVYANASSKTTDAADLPTSNNTISSPNGLTNNEGKLYNTNKTAYVSIYSNGQFVIQKSSDDSIIYTSITKTTATGNCYVVMQANGLLAMHDANGKYIGLAIPYVPVVSTNQCFFQIMNNGLVSIFNGTTTSPGTLLYSSDSDLDIPTSDNTLSSPNGLANGDKAIYNTARTAYVNIYATGQFTLHNASDDSVIFTSSTVAPNPGNCYVIMQANGVLAMHDANGKYFTTVVDYTPDPSTINCYMQVMNSKTVSVYSGTIDTVAQYLYSTN